MCIARPRLTIIQFNINRIKRQGCMGAIHSTRWSCMEAASMMIWLVLAIQRWSLPDWKILDLPTMFESWANPDKCDEHPQGAVKNLWRILEESERGRKPSSKNLEENGRASLKLIENS